MIKRKTLPLPSEIHGEIKLYAAQNGIGMSNLIADIWERFKHSRGVGPKSSALRRALMDQRHRCMKMIAELDGAIHDR